MKKNYENLEKQNARLRKITYDKLGLGIWGLIKNVNDTFSHDEIVFLFARIYQALGFDSVKMIRSPYPDCICIKDEVEVGIEFEPNLSSFRDHIRKQDDLNLCHYIVCWEDDLDLNDSMLEEIKRYNIQIFELKKIYEGSKIKVRSQKSIISISDIEKLNTTQLRILGAFIFHDKNKLSSIEIGDYIDLKGRGLGGALKAFTELGKKKIDWLLRKTPDKKWEINFGHRKNIIDTLKKYDIR